MVESKELLKIENLKKYYLIKSGPFKNIRTDIKAVEDINISVYEGETLGIVGESGCGKSTLGKTIIGLEEKTSGEIFFKNINIKEMQKNKKNFAKHFQMIFQDPFASLNPRKKIGASIEEIFTIHGTKGKKEKKMLTKSLLKEVGLKESHYDRYPHEFSGGQRQRVGIARAIALNPSLVICDEAVSALDVSVQAKVMKLLKNIQKKYNLTYLFISHDLAVVKYMSDRVLVMYLGAMAEMSTSKEIYENPLHPYTKALLSSIPNLNPGKTKERIILEGDIPSAANYPSGCPFHTRCPIATEICKKTKPQWREVEKDHFVACHKV